MAPLLPALTLALSGNTSAVTGTVSFAANATSATFSIPIINQHGLDKTFTITLGNATPSNLGTIISATPETVTIQGTAVVFNLSSPTYSVNESVMATAWVRLSSRWSDPA